MISFLQKINFRIHHRLLHVPPISSISYLKLNTLRSLHINRCVVRSDHKIPLCIKDKLFIIILTSSSISTIPVRVNRKESEANYLDFNLFWKWSVLWGLECLNQKIKIHTYFNEITKARLYN